MKKYFVCLCLAIVFIFSDGEVYTKTRKPVTFTKEQLMTTFEELWQTAVDNGLVKEKPRPEIVSCEHQPSENLAETWLKYITFYAGFFEYSSYEGRGMSIDPHKSMRFVVAHELGHYLLGHAEPILTQPSGSENWRESLESLVREECEANVFANRLIMGGAEDVLRDFDAAFRRTKKERVFALLLSPVSGIKDIVLSLKNRKNEVVNPLGKYSHYSRIHGPASQRAILVSEGKRQSCGKL